MKALLAGMRCGFSETVFATLRAQVPELEVAGLLLADPSSDDRHDEHEWIVPRRIALAAPALAAWIAAHEVDVAIVACFPWRIPASLLGTPRNGWLNVHPSLLPDWRGPQPVFHALRAGDATTGVTVHRLVDAFDSGPILRQREVMIGDETLTALEDRLARIGGELIASVIRNGIGEGTSQGAPGRRAGRIDAEARTVWTDAPAGETARWVRAVLAETGPLTIRERSTGEELGRIGRRAVVTAEPEPLAGSAPLARAGGTLRIRMSPGVLVVTCDDERRPRSPVRRIERT